MDTQELSDLYMEKFNELSSAFSRQAISMLVDDINPAVKARDTEGLNRLYGRMMEWNAHVSQFEGARMSIHTQFCSLRLPSPRLFAIIFDGEEKIWRFNI
jgi:hypothetical protein